MVDVQHSLLLYPLYNDTLLFGILYHKYGNQWISTMFEIELQRFGIGAVKL